jgi:cyclopropane-fatty-acyl-phospholipid synthase
MDQQSSAFRTDQTLAPKAAARLDAFRDFLIQCREQLGIPIGFTLWDGTNVPDNLSPNALRIVIADEGAVAALLRSPNAETLGNLVCAKRIDWRGGTLFDIAALRPRVRTSQFVKHVDKKLVLRLLRKFLFVPAGGPWPLKPQRAAPSDGDAAANRRNVSYHYDLSNAFYAFWLDREMVYSCGYAHDWTDGLDQMQQNKLEMICRKLHLKPGERLLDVGCGWGALLIYAARHYGVTGYGVTLSEQQRAHCQARIQALGLEGQVTVELKDYTMIEGEFDKAASIGAHEHVGLKNNPRYYQTVHKALRPGGLFLHHAITTRARPVGKKRPRRDFNLLTKYIFPGGELDTIGDTVRNLEIFGFEVHDVEGWREHYQLTCRHWHDRLLARYGEACAEVGEAKTRLWLIYLASCSIAFARNTALIYQTVASKRQRGTAGLPPTRAGLYAER